MAARESDRGGREDRGRPAERQTPSRPGTDRRDSPEPAKKQERGEPSTIRDTVRPPPKKGEGE